MKPEKKYDRAKYERTRKEKKIKAERDHKLRADLLKKPWTKNV